FTDYVATVHTGDATLDSTTNPTNVWITASMGGGFDVHLSYTYAEELTGVAFSVSATDHNATTSQSTTISVADAALSSMAADLTPPAATEGAAFNQVVFHFTDADPAGTVSDYVATVHTGDATLDSTTNPTNVWITASMGGGFDVHLSYTYAEELTGVAFSVSATDHNATTSQSTTISVADAALSSMAADLTPPAATEGAAFNQVVFHFTDADPAGTVSDYVATVHTGDATLDSTTNPTNVWSTASMGGGFDVHLSYTYAEELTGVAFSVSVTDHNATTSQSTTISVADAALSSMAADLTPPAATEGAAFNQVVFHFTDADPAGTVSDYVATVHTGDATLDSTTNPTNVWITASMGGGFDVHLSYTYAEELTGVAFSVSVTDHNATTSQSTTISVADAALSSMAADLTPPAATEGAAFNQVVFHFTDADPAGTVSDYVATVHTGDATLDSTTNPTNVWITASMGGGFDVHLSYTYAEELTGVAFSVSVTDHNATTSQSTTISVADAALSSMAADLTPPAATEGAAFNQVVFHFTDADPAGTVSDYVATVHTGDATLDSTTNPTNVWITASMGGGFDVHLSYTYAEELTGVAFSVSVTDHNATTSQSTTISVADAALSSMAADLTPPAATEGAAFNQVVFHFTDADPAGTVSDYVATVHTGDATLDSTTNPTNVWITASMGGGFDVHLS